MSARRRWRPLLLLAAIEVLAGLFLWVAAGPAEATNCAGSVSPDFVLTQTATPLGSGATSYDFVVTNDGTCGATNVDLVVQFGSPGTYTFNSVQRSWSCVQSGTRYDCRLQSTLDQKSTNSTGSAGTAEVAVTGPSPSTSNTKKTPPDVTEGAFVDDYPQVVDGITGHGPYDADDAIWTGVINPKTGGTVTTGFTALEPSISHTVTVPAGVAGSVGLAEKALDPRCQSPGLVPSCYSDVLVTAPTISNGYNTIVIRVNGTTPPPTPVFDDDLVAGPTQMLPCKGSTATPPCVVGIKGYNQSSTDPNNPPYFLVTIHDSSGTHIWS